MKLFFKHRINGEQADRLIEKYYDGFTTVEEEKMLQQFLSQQGLPEKYKAEQAMFAYLKPEQKSKTLPVYLRYAAVAALLLTGAFTIQTFVTTSGGGYAYIDGKKVTDKDKITEIAMASIREVTSSNNEVEQGLSEINNSELIEQQLDVFSGLDNLK